MASISIAMATYNGARFLPQQLASIAAQSMLPAELVITDDASTDDTLAVVHAFAATAPFPVRVHSNDARLGYRANFIRAMGLCASDLIALCDQDDVWEADKLAKLCVPFAEPDVLLAFHASWLIDAAGARTGLADIYAAPARNAPSSLFPFKNPYGFSMMVRRELLGFSDLWVQSVDNLFAGERMAHDQWLFFLASALGIVAYIEEPLAGYRQHGANTYGLVPPPRTWRQKASRAVNVHPQEFGSFAIAAETRASILAEAAKRTAGTRRTHALTAAVRYRELGQHCAWRAAAYRSLRASGRARAWWSLVRDGAYGNRDRWLFGRKAAIMDLAFAITPRHVLGALLPPERPASPISSA